MKVTRSFAARLNGWGSSAGIATAALVLVGLLLEINPGYFFTAAEAEEGDAAANALQILHAKSGDALLGNYSRWRFHHPGPVNWYVYAAGEVWLHDGLGITASPANAHSVAGLLWQAGFLTWAAWLAARAGWRGMSLAVAFALGFIVFTAVNAHEAGAVLMSLWPPHALLGPMVCFVVAAAAAAAGSSGAVLAMVGSGSVLVHGHVVMPLLVGPIGLLAGFAWWGNRPVGTRGGATLAAAGAIIVAALLPIGLELALHEPDNLDRILIHLGRYEGTDGLRALAYPLSFFAPGNRPEEWFSPAGNGLVWLWRQAPFALVFGALTLGIQLVVTVQDWQRAEEEPVGRFRRWLGTLLLLAWGLSTIWAWRQNGPLYQFNSFFQFGLVALLYASLTERLVDRLPVMGRQIAAGALGGGMLLVALSAPGAWRPAKHGTDPTALREAMAARLTAGVVHELRFAEGDWQKAAQVALELARSGERFEVAPEWGFLFGERYVAKPAPDPRRDTLRIARAAAPGLERWVDGVWAGPARLPALGPTGLNWRFGAEGNAAPYQWFGFSKPEPGLAWTEGSLARFAFTAPTLAQDRTLVLDCTAMGNSWVTQGVRVWLNDTEIGHADLPAERGEWRLAIPAAVWNAQPEVRLTFAMASPHSPASRGRAADYRELGLCFFRMWLE